MVQAKAATAFTYSDFSSTAGLNLVGTAAQNGNVLRLTPTGQNHIGSAWYTQQQQVAAGFTTTFSFQLTQPTPPGADGISFTIQNQGINAMADEQGSASSIGVSLNTFRFGNEPSDNFIGIYQNGYANVGPRLYTFDLNSTPIRMKDGNVHNVSLTYNGSAFSMSMDNLSLFSNVAISLTGATDLNGNAFVGFGGRTGEFWNNQDVLNWTFTPVPEPTSIALLAGGLCAGALWRSSRRKRQG